MTSHVSRAISCRAAYILEDAQLTVALPKQDLFVIELAALKGRERLGGRKVESLLIYE